ncbi:chromate transporter [Terrilactibacillus laevilacticus]|uniref:chromate transporter n=1 Tax=Terrilactibacillus laevilacticus TaxID=1380157 RepID=UPI0015EF6D4C|nr:chromate transporter [Terrilactibacillus laevilacticus]
MMSHTYKDLVIAMVRTGILGYGGGPSVMPLFRHEAVNRYHWLEDEEFGEVLALANALPGPIATKIAGYLGYRTKGSLGAAVAIIAHILPTCLAMIALASLINVLKSSPFIEGMIAAVLPVIAVMLGQMAYKFGSKAVKGLGWVLGFATFIIAFVMLQIIPVHPAIVIILFLAYGTVHYKLKNKINKHHDRDREAI